MDSCEVLERYIDIMAEDVKDLKRRMENVCKLLFVLEQEVKNLHVDEDKKQYLFMIIGTAQVRLGCGYD